MINESEFLFPNRDYGPVPFWFWNGEMEDEEIARQLSLMREQGVFEAIIHARKGLMVPYLSPLWFQKIRVACEAAKSLGMRLWIYDEDNWPSGYAGGRVLAKNPSFGAKCLSVEKIYPVMGKPVIVKEKPGCPIVEVTAVYQDREFYDITDCGRNGKEPWASKSLCWEVFVFREEPCTHCPAYSDTPYVDLLNPDATRAFIECTHAQYKKELPEYWGSVIRGFFTDEPGFYHNYLNQDRNLNTVVWTSDFAERFQKAYGYDIRPHLCGLWQNMPITEKTRHDFYQAVDRFYRESYFDLLSSFLHADGLLSIGHLHREEKLEDLVQTEGNFFDAIDGLDYSGIDCIDRAFPRVTEKLGASAANFLHKSRTLSETFGCFSWALTPEEMKQRIDLQYVQGVNMTVLHAFFYSIDGVRATECPPSEFFQSPYWPFFRLFSDYVSRLSYVLSQGERDAKVALYYPAEKATELFAPLDHFDVRLVDECLENLVGALLEKGIDFELVSEKQLRQGRVVGNQLFIDHGYDALILPCEPTPDLEGLIRDFGDVGTLLRLGKKKGFLAGATSYTYYEEADAVRFLAKELDLEMVGRGVYAYGRRNENQTVRFLVNSLNEKNVVSLKILEGQSVMKWGCESGQVSPLFAKGAAREVRLALEPKESILLVYSDTEGEPSNPVWEAGPTLKPESALFNGTPCKEASAHASGLHHFDGTIELIYSFLLPEEVRFAKVSLGKVLDFASVSCNDNEAVSRLWSPFEFDLSGYIHPGQNTLKVTVKNVLGNHFDGTDVDAGVLGPVTLEIRKE